MRNHAQAEMGRARKSLRAARLLCDDGLLEDAISRSYYAVLHAAKAALPAHDIVAESHAAVRRLFGRELIAPGRLDREWAAVLAHEQDQRIMADYDAQAHWEPANAGELVESAARFVDRGGRYIDTAAAVSEDSGRVEEPGVN